MSPTDIGFWIATGAAVVAAIYTGLGYHRPPVVPVAKPPKAKGGVAPQSQQKTPRQNRQIPILIALAAISWGGALFAYYTRSSERSVEYQLSPENADLDIRAWAKGVPNTQIQQYFVNAFTINRGKIGANNMTHNGVVAIGGQMANLFVDALFQSFKAQLKLLPAPALSSIRPGQDTTWFSVMGPPVNDALSKALADGTQLMFVFNVMRYQDDRLEAGKYIYTESCLYFLQEVAHICEGGHNRSYISD